MNIETLIIVVCCCCRPPDLYHSCYTLCGISIAQHSDFDSNPEVIGDEVNNELLPTHPLYNVPPKCVWQALMFFKNGALNDQSSRSPSADNTTEESF